MKSKVIEGMLREELERNERMSKRYKIELDSLPKGAIVKRQIGNFEYGYLTCREGKRVVSKYVGKVESEKFQQLEKQLLQRKKISEILKKLKIEESELRKVLK